MGLKIIYWGWSWDEGHSMKNKKEYLLKKMIKIIKDNPGIRPSDINRKLKVEHSWNLRKTLINQKYIKKIKKGNEVHYYSVK